jgi:hypothetical protein
MVASQMNVASMVNQMGLDFFYTSPTKSERERAQIWQLFVSISIWGAQTVVNSLIPTIPWTALKEYTVYLMSKTFRREFDSTGRLEHLTGDSFETWRTEVMNNAMRDALSIEAECRHLGSSSRPIPSEYVRQQIGGTGAAALQDWWSITDRPRSRWSRWVNERNTPNVPTIRGPMENLDVQDQWRLEAESATTDFLMDVWTRGLEARGGMKQYPLAPAGFRNMTKKLDATGSVINFLFPLAVNFAMPMYMRDVIDRHTWQGADIGHDRNVANLQWVVQEAGRYARRLVKDNVNLIFSSTDVGSNGRC